jgi:hypothetical protein
MSSSFSLPAGDWCEAVIGFLTTKSPLSERPRDCTPSDLRKTATMTFNKLRTQTPPIVVFTGKDYLDNLFYLMNGVKARKLVFHLYGVATPRKQGYEFLPYVPPDHIRELRTNWQYECAKDFTAHLPVREWALTPESERITGPDIERLWQDMRSNHQRE